MAYFYGNFYTITTVLSITAVIGHTPTNNSEVMVTYHGHSEVGDNKQIFYSETQQAKDEEGSRVRDRDEEDKDHDGDGFKDHKEVKSPKATTDGVADDGVVFVPNVKPVMRNEDLVDGAAGVGDLMMKRLGDVMEEKKVIVDTESPNGDVVFISGRNRDRDNEEKKAKNEKEKIAEVEVRVVKKLNCTNLDCDTNQEPVCGGKVEQSRWRYRMFLNGCFLTKVNCGFRNAVNRYRQVDMQKCKDVASRSLVRPEAVPLRTYGDLPPRPVQNETRRSSARRSLNRGADGQFCSHSCPLSCTEEYEPQCAVSGTGRKQVFMNHCKLDLNSCARGTVWHQRPLSWCVGGRLADARQNRGFISWMQRAGIVDGRGKLTLH